MSIDLQNKKKKRKEEGILLEWKVEHWTLAALLDASVTPRVLGKKHVGEATILQAERR